MTTIDRTAYPQLNIQLSDDELTASYTLSEPELFLSNEAPEVTEERWFCRQC